MSKQKPGAKLTALIVAVVGTVFVVNSLAATSSATLSLSSSSSSVGLGSTFTVAIHENSGTDAVNAVQSNLTYSTNTLQFVSIDYSTSGFATQAQSTTATGTITIARGATTSITGDQIIGVATFKAIALGTGSVGFSCIYSATTCSGGNAVLRSSDNTNILTTQTPSSYAITDMTPPSIPAGLTATATNVTSIALSWTAATDNVGVTGYNIYRNGVKVGTSSTTTYTDNGLTPNTTYTYTVAAFDAAGNTSAQSSSLAPKTAPDTSAPTTPGTPTQGSRTMTSMIINWTAATDNVGVTGYKIFRDGTQVSTSSTTSFSDSSLAPGATYTYSIAAFDAAGNTSAQSAGAALATAPDTSPPTAPTSLNVSAQTATTVSLSWTAATDNVGVTGYKIYRNSSTTALATVNNVTSYIDSTVSASTAYTYQVSAIDAAGNESPKSTVLAVTTNGNGDLNGDGHVNIFDLSIFLNHWQQTGSGIPEDFNNDNIVNIFDLSILLNNYGK